VTRLRHGGVDISTARPQARVQTGARDWYRIEMRGHLGDISTLAEVWIYDEIGYFGVTASDFVRELAAVDSDKIVVHLNTPGGDAFDGIAIYGALKSHKAHVEMRIDSLAASAGSFIAQAGDERIIARNATVMIHDAHGLVVGNHADMTAMAELLDKTSDNVADIYAQRAGGTVESWRAAMKAETWYNADEAVAAGLADRVDDYTPATGNAFDLAIFSYAGRQEAPAPVLPEPAVVVDQVPEVEVFDLGFIDALRGAHA
jgi:ATP-dependent protease ClpP protease subunit